MTAQKLETTLRAFLTLLTLSDEHGSTQDLLVPQCQVLFAHSRSPNVSARIHPVASTVFFSICCHDSQKARHSLHKILIDLRYVLISGHGRMKTCTTAGPLVCCCCIPR